MAEQRSARAAGPARTRKKATPSKGPEYAARAASKSLEGLIGHPAEGVSALQRTEDDGWCVVVDVLEVARVPDTTSLLASYEVLLSESGELQEYRRVRRYRRGAADE